jgi:tRNA pseudouridine55 synthase
MPFPAGPSGVLLVDKPVGPTSFDVVRAVRRALRVKSAGHTGTLDPNASGLLPLCLGDATRIASFITEGTKVYDGVVRFGVETATLDAEGTVTATRDASHLDRQVIEGAVAQLIGRQTQITPMYSARKVDGKRLYELAREGQEVERPEHEITVERAELLDWAPPDATVRIRCSKGTYIRSLAALLGERLETGAHLKALRRHASGALNVSDALPLDTILRLSESDPAALAARILTVEQALVELPALRLDQRTAISVAFGNPVPPGMFAVLPVGAKVRLLDPEGWVVAVGEAAVGGGFRLARVLRARTGPGGGGH